MAVYTRLAAQDIAAHLARYALGDLVTHQEIAEGVENTTYALTTTSGRYILTLFEKRADPAGMDFWLGFMRALDAAGLPTAEVLLTGTGEATPTLHEKKTLITRFLKGRPHMAPTPDDAAAMGALLARMHLAGATHTQRRENPMGHASWCSLIAASVDRADSVSARLVEELDRALHETAALASLALPRGAIHGDAFPDNIFFDEHGHICGIIDFSFACTDFLAYDLMLTLNAWCSNDGALDETRAQRFLAAYTQIRPLSADETAALPLLGQAAALRIVATRLYDLLHPSPEALVKPKDPLEHLQLLRLHRTRTTTGYGWWPA